MRILLINAPHPAIGSRIPHERLPPLGLLAIGGPLIDAGHDVRLLDAEFGPMPTAEIVARCVADAPSAILMGHSGSTSGHPVVAEITRALRHALPAAWIVYGGVFPTYPISPARGCSNSHMTTFGPEVWPDVAREWYALCEKHFWQHRLWAVGFREWPRGDEHGDWYFDVDSGPVIAGHGTAACAYGIGAARTNGRFDQAWPLSAEALAMSWPLPSGTLAGARILSNATDAPYLGEAGMLFIFTRQPLPSFAEVKGGRLTGYVYVILCAYLAVAAILVLGAWRSVRPWRRDADWPVPLEKCRFVAWAALMLGAVAIFLLGPWQMALVSLFLAQFVAPAQKRRAAKCSLSEVRKDL